MIRAILFDFYSVWAPDTLGEQLEAAKQAGPAAHEELRALIERYYRGQASVEDVAEGFRVKLSRPDIDASLFSLQSKGISPALGDFMRNLHAHFLKLGVLANLGPQEYQLLTNFNTQNELLEAIVSPYSLQLDQHLLSKEVFARALQAIGEPPQSCLVVTGHQDYQQFAESLGIATVPFEGFPKLQQTLEQILAQDTPSAL